MCTARTNRTKKSEAFLGSDGESSWDTMSCVYGTVKTVDGDQSQLLERVHE